MRQGWREGGKEESNGLRIWAPLPEHKIATLFSFGRSNLLEVRMIVSQNLRRLYYWYEDHSNTWISKYDICYAIYGLNDAESSILRPNWNENLPRKRMGGKPRWGFRIVFFCFFAEIYGLFQGWWKSEHSWLARKHHLHSMLILSSSVTDSHKMRSIELDAITSSLCTFF